MAKDAPEYDEYRPLKKGDRGVSVLRMQKRLKELGYDPGKLDGQFKDDNQVIRHIYFLLLILFVFRVPAAVPVP